MAAWVLWGCLPFLAAAFITDIGSMKIPNWLSVLSLVTGVLMQGIMHGLRGLLFAGGGAATGFILLLIMYFIGAVGAGDVKFFAGIGAWTGLLFTMQVIMYSVLFGAVIGWIILLARRETGERVRRMVSRTAGFFLLHGSGFLNKKGGSDLLRFPFMLAVVPGFVCTYIYY